MYYIHGISDSSQQHLPAEAGVQVNARLAAQLPASGSLADQLRAEAGSALIALGTWIKPRTLSEAYKLTQLPQSGVN